MIRIVYFLQAKDNALFLAPVLDASFYFDWVRQITGGSILGREAFFMNPGYPYFLALLSIIVGMSVSGLIIAQMSLSSITCVLVAKITGNIFGRSAMLVAGILMALYGYDIFYSGTLLTASVINLINVIILLLLLNDRMKPEKRYILIKP